MVFRDVLARDIRDVRQIAGSKYDPGLRQLLQLLLREFSRTDGEVEAMTVRKAVEDFVKLGPLPESSAATEQDLDQRVALLKAIAPPVSDEEATALADSFGPD